MTPKYQNPKSKIERPAIRWIALVVIGLAFAAKAGAATYCYVTLHNLGCLQSNQTYTGFIYPHPDLGEGDLVQVILAGANRVIDLPNADGSPGGDDQAAMNPGAEFAMNPESFTHYPGTFYSPEAMLVQSDNHGPQPAVQPGSKFYLRVWNGATPAQSTAYYNSRKLTLDYPATREGCPIDSAVRTFPNEIQIPMLFTYAVVLDDLGHPYSPLNTVMVSAPNGGEAYAIGELMEVQWFATATYSRVDVLLQRGAGPWVTILDSVVNDGSEAWAVTGPDNAICRIRVQAAVDTIVFDTSDSAFAINPAPTLMLHEPDPDDILTTGELVTIGWTSTGTIPAVRILLSRDAAPAETLFAAAANDGGEDWVVSGPEAANCRFRIESTANPTVYDDVTPVTIVEPLSILLHAPVAGDSFALGDTMTYSWSTTGSVGPLRLILTRDAAPAETLFALLNDDGGESWLVTTPATDSATIRLESSAFPAVHSMVYPVVLTDSTYSGPPISPEVVASSATDTLRVLWHPVPYATAYRVETSTNLVDWDSVTTQADTTFAFPTPELMPPARYYRVIGIR
ncbi:hypothetical protein HZB60_12725 [candidate division KSB1 bacterium]|nr:hypothetical protein [candidate division KSB1 bacterium]